MKNGLVAGAINEGGATEEAPSAAGYSEDRALAPGGQPDPEVGAAEDSADAEDDDQYELDLEKVLTAAARAMQTPDIEDSLRELRQSPDVAQGMADLAATIVDGLDQASGATIPEDVLPGAALGIAAMIGDVIGADSANMTMAAQKLVLGALQQDGVDPEEMQQALAQADFNGMVQKAVQQLGGGDGA